MIPPAHAMQMVCLRTRSLYNIIKRTKGEFVERTACVCVCVCCAGANVRGECMIVFINCGFNSCDGEQQT